MLLLLVTPSAAAFAAGPVGKAAAYPGPLFMNSFTSFEMDKKPPPGTEGFSKINLERWWADFFDEHGNRTKRLVATRSDIRGGMSFFSGQILSLGVGTRATQMESKVYYAKPETTLRLNVYESDLFDLKAYSQVVFPLKESLVDPTSLAQGGMLETDMAKAVDKTVITGITPTAKFRHRGLKVYVSGDGKAIKYTKSHHSDSVEGRPDLDDTTYRYTSKFLVGLGLTLGVFSMEASGAYETRYIPEHYFNLRNQKWEYIYYWERVSYSTIRAVLAPKPTFNIYGEATYIRNGFFNKDRTGDQMRLNASAGINLSL